MSIGKTLSNLEEVADIMRDEMRERHADAVEDAIDIIHLIHQWSEAYPEDIFLPVDWKQAHAELKACGISGSALAADCMRYVVLQMKKSMEKIVESD